MLASYRLYCLDGAGKITTAEWLESDSDASVLEQVRQRRLSLTCEVWDRQRLVGKVAP